MTQNIIFPPEVLSQHIAVLGKTGSGKTSTAKLIVEQVVPQGARVCILDPVKSDWWGLTSSADGKSAGMPFHILGGPRGHIALHADAGGAVGELVATGKLPLSIIDMADFEPGGHAKFFKAFAAALMRHMRGVLYLVIEEAHLFAPKERSGLGDENMSVHWSKMIATAGRSKGIRSTWSTQRTQALHNAVLGSCDTVIAHRQTAPADQEPVIKWLKANVERSIYERVISSMASLKTGQGWLCSGEARIAECRQFPRIRTYDNTATPTDDDRRHEVRTATVDLTRLEALVGEAVAEVKANDPAELKKRIKVLEQQLAAKPAAAAPTVQRVEVPMLTEAQTKDLSALRNEASVLASKASDLNELAKQFVADACKLRNEVLAAVARATPNAKPTLAGFPIVEKQFPPAVVAAAQRTVQAMYPSATVTVGSGDRPEWFRPAHQRLLNALAWLETMGEACWKRELVAAIAQVSPNSSSFSNDMSRLSANGLVEYPSPGMAQLTEAGRELAEQQQRALTLSDLHQAWRKCPALRPAHVRLIDTLIEDYPNHLTREQLADRVGVSASSSSFSNDVSRLSSFGLARYPKPGIVAAGPMLFPEELV